VVGNLSDGSRSKPLVPLQDLVLNLDLCSVLLPVGYEYQDAQGSPVAAETLRSIVDVNVHGSSGLAAGCTCLLPTVAMINHSRTPNTSFLERGNKTESVAMVVASRSIKAGEEVFMKYQDDEVVLEKWGITG
jgi:SET domain